MNLREIPKFVALVLTVVLGVGYILFGVIGIRWLHPRFGVSVVLPSAGGIYTEAAATYRGVEVGKVTSLHLQRNDVVVHVGINPGVHIPLDSTAAVKEMTAAGEQYIDFVPVHSNSSGPYLHQGSVIPMARTAIPVSIDSTLVNLSQLMATIPKGTLATLNSALAKGFGGNGNALRALIENGSNLAQALQASAPQQIALSTGGHKVLETALATGQEFTTFTRSLESISQQLKQSNPDLSALLVNGAAAAKSSAGFFNSISPGFQATTNGLGTIVGVTYARNAAFETLFSTLPSFATKIASISSDGVINSQLYYNTTGAPVCSYLSASQLPLPTQKAANADLNNGCSISSPDMLQRGAAHAPQGSSGG